MKNVQSFYLNKRVLITGGAGFIGSHIAQTLCNYGAHVTVMDDLSSGKISNLAAFCTQAEVIINDVTSFKACLKATEGQDIVFHLAAMVSVPESIKQPKLCEKINIDGTNNMLEACNINRVTTFIFSSSSAVYGNKNSKCCEDDPLKPQSPYAQSKLAGEILCKEYAQTYDMSTACLRYFNVYGDRQNPQGAYAGVVAKFKKHLLEEKPLTIYGDGTQLRDFVPVANVVEANLTVGMQKNLRGEVFNIASGKSITLLELISLLEQETQKKRAGILFEPTRAGDIFCSQANCSKFAAFRNSLDQI